MSTTHPSVEQSVQDFATRILNRGYELFPAPHTCSQQISREELENSIRETLARSDEFPTCDLELHSGLTVFQEDERSQQQTIIQQYSIRSAPSSLADKSTPFIDLDLIFTSLRRGPFLAQYQLREQLRETVSRDTFIEAAHVKDEFTTFFTHTFSGLPTVDVNHGTYQSLQNAILLELKEVPNITECLLERSGILKYLATRSRSELPYSVRFTHPQYTRDIEHIQRFRCDMNIMLGESRRDEIEGFISAARTDLVYSQGGPTWIVSLCPPNNRDGIEAIYNKSLRNGDASGERKIFD